MRKTLCVLLAALAFGGLVFSEAQAMHAGKPHRYVVILIDQFPGHPENGAKAVNASGTVVGWSGVHDGEASIGTHRAYGSPLGVISTLHPDAPPPARLYLPVFMRTQLAQPLLKNQSAAPGPACPRPDSAASARSRSSARADSRTRSSANSTGLR